MNITLAKEVQQRILAEPKLVNMNHWCITGLKKKVCDTVGCIAGHAVLAVGISPKAIDGFEVSVRDIAQALLEMSTTEADHLFYFMNFFENEENPYSFQAKQLKKQRPGSERYAKIVAKVIDMCIERHKVLGL